jgi:hypothetical protein
MSFSEILAVSKLPGLYQMHKHRSDGLILKSLQDDKVFFAASRAHSFTPLDNITIYTVEEPMELIDVMLKIKEHKSKLEIPSPKASGEELKKFLLTIIPDYDESRVYTSDIQKIVKWYSILEAKDLIQPRVTEVPKSAENIAESNAEIASEVAEEPKPKAKTTRKKKTEE